MPRNSIVTASVVLAAILVGLALYWFSPGVRVEAARVTRGDAREYIDEEGKTRLSETYQVTMPFAGRVEAIDLIEGTTVSQGQTVAQIVPRDLDLQVAAATAAVERLKASIRENDDARVELTTLRQAMNMVVSMDRTVDAAAARVESGKAKLDFAEKNFGRASNLFKGRSGSQAELDQAEVNQVQSRVDYQQDRLVLAAMQALQAAVNLAPTIVQQYIDRKVLPREVLEKQLAEAEVAQTQAERDRARGTLKSPVDGVVLERLVSNEGQLSAGTLLLRIGRWQDLQVEADVLSQEVVRVKPGDQAQVLGPAIGPKPILAKVERIYPAGFTKISSLGVEQQRVKVVLSFAPDVLTWARDQRGLGVDYRVRVRIFTALKSNALVVPRAALFRGPAGDWQVFAIRGGRATLQTVKVGLSNDQSAEITDGLAADELVIIAPETTLSSGQAVDAHLHQLPAQVDLGD